MHIRLLMIISPCADICMMSWLYWTMTAQFDFNFCYSVCAFSALMLLVGWVAGRASGL